MAFKATITADVAGFTKGMREAQQEAQKAGESIERKMSDLGDSLIKVGAAFSTVSLAIVGVTKKLAGMALEAGNTASTLLNLETATGISTKTLQELGHVAVSNNGSFEGLQQSIIAFQRRLKEVGDDGDTSIKTLKRIGVEVKNTDGSFRSMDDVLKDTLYRLGDLEDGLEKQAIGTRLFGRNWQDASLVMSAGSEGIKALSEEAHNLGLVIEKDALTKASDFGTAMEILNTRVKALKTSFGSVFGDTLLNTVLPIIEDSVLPMLQSFSERLGALMKRFEELSPSVQKTILIFGALTVAVPPLVLALGGLLKILPLLATGFAALTGPIGLAVAGVTAGAVLIITNWEKVKQAFEDNEFLNELKGYFVDFIEFIKPLWKAFTDVFIGQIKNAWENIKTIFDIGFSVITGVLKTFIDFFKDTIGIIGSLIKGDFRGALDGMVSIWENVFNNIWNTIKRVIGNISKLLGRFLKTVGLKKWGEGLLDFGDSWAPKMEKVQEQFKETTKAVEETTKAVVSLSKEALEFEKLDLGKDIKLRVRDVKVDVNPEDVDMTWIDDLVLKMNTDAINAMKLISIDLNTMLADVMQDAFSAVFNAIASGDNVLQSLGASLLSSLGAIMKDLGQMVLLAGTAIETVKASLASLNGVAAIAVGGALMAIGAAFSAGARSLSSSMGRPQTRGGYASSVQVQPLPTKDYDINVVGEFRIEGDDLVAVLGKKQAKLSRL